MPDFSNILLATDLDGTFFDGQSKPHPRNLEAAAYFKAHGGHLIASTGRVFPNLLRVIPNAAEVFNAPSVTSNGAYIYDFATGEVLDKTPMNAEMTKRLVLEVQAFNPNVGMRVSDDGGFLVNANCINEKMQKEIASPFFVGKIIPVEDWDTAHASWYKMVLRGSHEELCEIRDALYPAYAEYFEFCASAPTLFEMQAKGCTKAGGGRLIARMMEKKLGHSLKIVTVGDQENDIPMLADADLSACPENAVDSVKSVADLTLCHHHEGVVADLIAYLDKHPMI